MPIKDIMTSQKLDQYSEIPTTESKGKLWKVETNLNCQFFSLTFI